MNKEEIKVLIACEESQAVTSEFIKLGFKNTFSCDILPTSGKYIENHLQKDVTEVLKEHWDLIIAFPPCFSGDTLVLTKDGYKEISKIKIGEFVLTHKGRWRKVTNIMNHYENTRLRVRITGSNDIITTENHPFFSKTRSWKCKRINGKLKNIKIETDSSWTEAGNLRKGNLVGSVLPPIENSHLDISNEHLWLMGLYLADGHLRIRRNKFESVFFSIGKHQLKKFKLKIN